MAIQRRTYVPKNKIYYPINKIEIGQYYLLEMSPTLEYFTIIDKIINKCKDNNIIKEKENSIFKSEPISSRAINIGSYSEPYKEKSFFENASFFLSTVKKALRIVSLDTKMNEINEYKKSLKVYSMAEGVYYAENETYKNMINKFFRKYPEYKQAKDTFDRLENEKNEKILQMNNLILELNKFRLHILAEYNPIVLELLDLLQENESNIKIEYMNFLGKLHQKINYCFKSTSSKNIIKSDMLLKWDELKSNIEILEKDNKELDNEIDKILKNDSFKNYKNQNLEYFHPTKVKLNSLIKQNALEINKLPEVKKDKELENLKKELKSLEEKLQNLVIEKTEYLNTMEEFNTQYTIHLGDIIKSILSLKKEILYKKTIKYQKIKDNYEEEIKTFDETTETISELKETISELEEALENIDKDDENYDEIYKAYQELQEELENLEDELYSQKQKLDDTKEQLEDDELFNEYEDVKSAYDEFENEYEHIKDTQKDINKLNDDEKIEIKKLYKKAARLCHPDIVSDELKEKAHEIMQSLNDAYSKKDIKKVKEILLNLETGKSFELSSDSIEDKEILKAKIEEFKQTIQELKNEIEEIKSDDTFITISSLDDWDEYFEDLRRDLEEEKEKLEIEAQEIIEEKKEVEEWMKVLWEWASENNLIHHYFESEKVHLGFPKKIKEFKYLESLEISDAWTLDPDALPLGISKPIPNEICNLKYLKNLRIMVIGDNLTEDKKNWLKQLLKNGCNVGIWNGNDEYFDFDSVTLDSDIFKNDDFLIVNEQKTTTKEISYYSKYIQNIENIRFEKIRKYCENLSKENEADEMQEYLGGNGYVK